jgi:hypothetical protein
VTGAISESPSPSRQSSVEGFDLYQPARPEMAQ